MVTSDMSTPVRFEKMALSLSITGSVTSVSDIGKTTSNTIFTTCGDVTGLGVVVVVVVGVLLELGTGVVVV